MTHPTPIYEPTRDDSIRQGEIISNLIQVKIKLESIASKKYVAVDVEHPLAIVVTQDCDLEQDFKARFEDGKPRRMLPNILFCEVETAQAMIHGSHQNLFKSSTVKQNFKNNDDFRFHFLQNVTKEQDLLSEGLDEMGVEFKRYFTIPTEEVYYRIENRQVKRRCRLRSPYLEHFSTRFHYYHYRVALPNDHAST